VAARQEVAPGAGNVQVVVEINGNIVFTQTNLDAIRAKSNVIYIRG